ncbi:MAG TPA: serine protease [Polyangiaceae bacterium]
MLRVFCSVVVCGLLCACSDPEIADKQDPPLPSFHDVQDGSALVKASAEAVVRIETAGEFATGVFISADGTLLTNNHVLGAPVCAKEGCYAWLSFDYQRGVAPTNAALMFVVPFAVDLALDIAALHVLSGPGGSAYAPPAYLNLVPRSSASLVGEHITLIGHPEGALKKWTDGTVVDATEDWFRTTAFALPGDSGSPVLDDHGNMIGINHRGPTSEDLITSNNVNVFTIGSASEPVLQALAAPTLPPGMVSVQADTTADRVVENHFVYLNSHALTASVAGTQTPVIDLLGAACDAGLARGDYTSIDDLELGIASCEYATYWIDCRSDSTTTGQHTCPSDTGAWAQRYTAANALKRSIGSGIDFYLASYARAELASDQASGTLVAQEAFQQALAESVPPLDFYLAEYLASLQLQNYQGVDIASYARGYAQVPGYSQQASYIATLAEWLDSNGWWTRSDMLSTLLALDGDPNVSVGSKLSIETSLYYLHAL